MNKDQKIQAIREACIAVNPEIVELKFGCEVSFINMIWFFAGYGREDKGLTYMLTDGIVKNGKQSYTTASSSDKDFKILGRPIRLSDVLLAIGKKSGYYSIDSTGRFQVWKDVGLRWCKTADKKFAIAWNPLRDSLEDQEESTINFIHELIQK